MTNLNDFLILPVDALDQLLAKSPSTVAAPAGFSSVDESGLLPGASEARTTAGVIVGALTGDPMQTLHFAPLSSQIELTNLNLKAGGVPLFYQLDENNQQLTATAGIDGFKVFSVELKQDGSYAFTLHHQIDRACAPNLLSDSLWETTQNHDPSKMSQLLTTEPNMPYQFTLYYLPGLETAFEQLQIHWNHQLLQTISTQHSPCGYAFSVEGNYQSNHTLLEIIGLNGTGSLNHFIKDISVISTAQSQLPIDFLVLTKADGQTIAQSDFIVNVTTTPAIELNNQKHFDIFYEQSVYQTIIVNDENAKENPLATINLDTLFKQLAIEQDNRLVEVVQRTEDGVATNVYEIKISDKAQAMEPITIADVQLSFPGGNGGITVFERHISIDEGSASDTLPPLLDMV